MLAPEWGNVLAVVNDNVTPAGNGTYQANVISANDYYAFGSQMPGRSFNLGGSYRYGFNGKENDNEVKGEGNQQDYGMRIYDPRIGRFLSMDPIMSQYPALTPYQFSSNSPIANIDLDGLEAKLAISGVGGDNTAYESDHAASFSNRAMALKSFGFNPVAVHSGQTIINELKKATKTEGSISAIVSFAHGGATAIFLNNDDGLYMSNRLAGGAAQGNVSQIARAINKGEIKFATGAIWIFASCNAGNSSEIIKQTQQPVGDYNLARNVAGSLGIKTIGARGFVSPLHDRNGNETGVQEAGPYNGVSYENMGFVLFEPITTTTVKKVNKTIMGISIPFTEKEIKETKITVKETFLGKTINPSDYVQK
ncbi:RHS repeat domain-containing protein [Pedobacter helvus]|uniref:RHS repeat domain-containing protein n=1 Tax=Pedobacter helvus TaxID=2563444 RepID=A0ABW9JDM9_9SPHI|nr:RHS repeat-associated core domain-containing protein [Pedobacter ureilyticus]